jgi:hypothetical protein
MTEPILPDPPAVAWVRARVPLDRNAHEQTMLDEYDALRARCAFTQADLRTLDDVIDLFGDRYNIGSPELESLRARLAALVPPAP